MKKLSGCHFQSAGYIIRLHLTRRHVHVNILKRVTRITTDLIQFPNSLLPKYFPLLVAHGSKTLSSSSTWSASQYILLILWLPRMKLLTILNLTCTNEGWPSDKDMITPSLALKLWGQCKKMYKYHSCGGFKKSWPIS